MRKKLLDFFRHWMHRCDYRTCSHCLREWEREQRISWRELCHRPALLVVDDQTGEVDARLVYCSNVCRATDHAEKTWLWDWDFGMSADWKAGDSCAGCGNLLNPEERTPHEMPRL